MSSDKSIFIVKRLINQFLTISDLILVSVKKWCFTCKKQIFIFRNYFLWILEKEFFPRGRPLAQGMLLGDTSGVSQELYQYFKVIGILHLLSASSSNLNLFLSIFKPIFLVFNKIFLRENMFFVYLSVIFVYFSLVGGSASMLRAVFLISLVYFSKFYLKRAYFPLYLLFIVAVLMLLINPFYLSSLGFKLSFLACFGIYYLFAKLKIGKNGFVSSILNSLLLTISAQFFLLIIFITSFGELNYIGIIANLLISPLLESLTIGFLLLILFAFFSKTFIFSKELIVFKHFLSFLLFKAVNIFEVFLDLLNKIPYKTIIINDNKILYMVVIFLLNVFMICFLESKKKESLKKEKYRIFK